MQTNGWTGFKDLVVDILERHERIQDNHGEAISKLQVAIAKLTSESIASDRENDSKIDACVRDIEAKIDHHISLIDSRLKARNKWLAVIGSGLGGIITLAVILLEVFMR